MTLQVLYSKEYKFSVNLKIPEYTGLLHETWLWAHWNCYLMGKSDTLGKRHKTQRKGIAESVSL